MTKPSPDSRRPRRAWLLLPLLGALAAWLFFRSDAPAEGPAPQALAQAAPPREGAPATLSAPSPPGTPSEAPPDTPRAAEPIVDEVRVEKAEVCSGEDNLITVRAHTPDGNDAYLHYTVGDGTGQRIPVRVWRNDADGSYELPRVTVFTRDNVSVTVPVPAYRVKDCEPERLVHVMSRRQPNTDADFEFLAQVVDKPGAPGQPRTPPFVPVRYVWTFDDAATQTTSGPMVSHTLASGAGTTSLYDQHLVRVDVYDAAGRKETGRSSLQLLNTSFENFAKKGIVTLLAQGTPRFPVLDADGVVRQTFRLTHHFQGPVRLTRVSAIRAFQGTEHGPPPPEQVDPASLPVGEVPPGQGVEVKVAFDTRAEPDVFAITYALEGQSADGHPARGTFSVMRPPPRPTRDNSTAVLEPVLLAKIKRARELLHQEFVTDEDIFRLEREGRLQDLKVEPAPPAPTGAPPRNPAR